MSDRTIAEARKFLSTRKKRGNYFKKELFDEQDWDLMLVLYIAGAEGRQTDRQAALRQVDVGATVLERWITVLSKENIIDGEAAAADDLRLSPDGQDRMRRLLSEVSEG